MKQSEHLAVLNLVPCEAVTHRALTSGDWDDPAIWDQGVPGSDANVLIPDGVHVLIDAMLAPELRTVRVDGELSFAPNKDTALRVDTIVVTPSGILNVGTAAAPIASNVTAQVTFADRGVIDTNWDPLLFSRGLISHGRVSIDGAEKTPYVQVIGGLQRRSTKISLSAIPEGWRAGDQIVITGVKSNGKQDQQIGIRSISRHEVTLDGRLKQSHELPVAGAAVYAANLTRNVIFESENRQEIAQRGHIMFMHSPAADVDDAAFIGLGRTNKDLRLDNVQLDSDGRFIPGTGTNPVGRYSVHFHRTGTGPGAVPGEISGSVVVDGPGWGIVNHSSNVFAEDNVVYHVVGAAYVTEAGDEIGAFRRNIAIKSTGSGDPIRDREKIQDFGHTGVGFWFQGAGVEVVDNIAAGQAHLGYAYFTEGLRSGGQATRFLAKNLPDPSLAGGHETVPVGAVPIRLFHNNQVFASGRGLEVWFHLQGDDALGQSDIDQLTAWGTKNGGTFFGYSANINLKNAVILGNTNRPEGIAVDGNDGLKNIVYENVRAEGFLTGIEVPLAGTIQILGGKLHNVHNVHIASAAKHGRTVTIQNVQFTTLNPGSTTDLTPFHIYMTAQYDHKDLDITKTFNPDLILQTDSQGVTRQLYYKDQAPEFVPFAPGTSPAFVPPELLGKTNTQLVSELGLAVGGALAPQSASVDPAVHGMVGPLATYPPHPYLVSDKYTNQLTAYQLVYRIPDGDRVVDPTPVDLRAGWNVITRLIGGQNESFFVYATP